MTRKEFAVIMAYLEAACGKPLPPTSLDVYFDLLGDLPSHVLQVASKRVALEHKWASFPSVAELRLAASETILGDIKELSASEAWRMAYCAACKIDPSQTGPWVARNKAGEMQTFDSQRQYACDGLPPLVVEAMESFGFAALANSDPNYARPQFIKIFDQLAAREKKHALLPEAVKRQIKAAGEKQIAPPSKLSIGVFKDGA